MYSLTQIGGVRVTAWSSLDNARCVWGHIHHRVAEHTENGSHGMRVRLSE